MRDTCLAPEQLTSGQCLPKTLLDPLNTNGFDGVLQVKGFGVEWFIYFREGQIVYTTNSVDPLERLERCLRGFSQQQPELTQAWRNQACRQFEDQAAAADSPFTADYQAMLWLVDQGRLDILMAGTLASKITAEVFESYLLLPSATYEIQHILLADLPAFCALAPQTLIARTQERLQLWAALPPQITSPYQRPYLAGEILARQKLSPETVSSLSRLLVGFNFRQLGMLTEQDDLLVAKRFAPLITQGVVILREPVSPFDRLPRIRSLPPSLHNPPRALPPAPVR